MAKKIVVCCDGTGNSFDRVGEESNVAKLYSSLTINAEQRGYYHPGVGTMGAPNSHGQSAANGRRSEAWRLVGDWRQISVMLTDI